MVNTHRGNELSQVLQGHDTRYLDVHIIVDSIKEAKMY